MIQKLPPPYIEGSIIGQYGNVLHIPFEPNRAVNIANSTITMQARIKTVATNSIVAQLKEGRFAKTIDNSHYEVEFNLLEDIKLTPGQYYKIQLAFDNGILGYYSTVGIFKYTNMPTILIEKLANGEQGNLYTYTGVYKNDDITEKVYSYRFCVTQNGLDTLIADSGILLHDSTKDTENDFSSDTWILNQQLTPGLQYTITYNVTTINGVEASSSYTIVNNEFTDDDLLKNCKIEPELDFNNGRIFINLKTTQQLVGQGGFVLSRTDSKSNYSTWCELMTFTSYGQTVLPEQLWIDYAIEQGIGYKYSLQRFNDAGFFTKRLENESPIIADFEDMFLYDGNRQLKIRFNPKVSSFKNTILETKVDTIGGKYPFIFRNGDVKYKEFPISGLISYLSDQDELFMSNMELGFVEENVHRHFTHHNGGFKSSVRNTQVDTQNISAERLFKLQVLDWLTNGKPKLFRSPSEGNYIVRIMNTSMTPNDTINRMIHTFNATAYEIAENNFENLLKYGFVQNVSISNQVKAFASLDLNFDHIPYHNLIEEYANGVYSATFVNVPPGTIFSLLFLGSVGAIDICIPSNGYYKVNIYDNPLISVKLKFLPDGIHKLSGLLDIGYYTEQGVGDFSDIRRIAINNYSATYIGETREGIIKDHIAQLTNIKYSLGYFYYLRVENREILNIYKRGNNYYISSEKDSLPVEFENKYLYYIVEGAENNKHYIDGNDPTHTPFLYPNYSLRIGISQNKIEEILIGAHDQAGLYVLPSVDSINYLSLGNGLISDFMCQKKEYIYCIEEDNQEVANAYQQWRKGEITDIQYFAILKEHGIKEK